jgi:hypothetical protein
MIPHLISFILYEWFIYLPEYGSYNDGSWASIWVFSVLCIIALYSTMVVPLWAEWCVVVRWGDDVASSKQGLWWSLHQNANLELLLVFSLSSLVPFKQNNFIKIDDSQNTQFDRLNIYFGRLCHYQEIHSPIFFWVIHSLVNPRFFTYFATMFHLKLTPNSYELMIIKNKNNKFWLTCFTWSLIRGFFNFNSSPIQN